MTPAELSDIRAAVDAWTEHQKSCEACTDSPRGVVGQFAAQADRAALLAEVDRISKTVGAVLERSGCSCDCDHGYTEHDPECERCLACEISEALTPAAAPTATHQGDTAP